jgi:SAM-dependent methyltransferase
MSAKPKESEPSPSSRIGIFRSARQWWNNIAATQGHVFAARRLVAALWEFARDSTPHRRRQRYGDTGFDWDHRVNTTSAAITWRNRLLGVFHSPYQPTEGALFHEMLSALREQTGCDFHGFVFVDLGSGKGRALLMASNYPFRRVIGVELLPDLHRVSVDNLAKYKSGNQKCFALESIPADATEFEFPADPIVLYIFNPFPEAGLRRVIANLEKSLRSHPRKVYVIYHNPLLEGVVRESTLLRRLFATHQFALYESI